MERYQRIGDFLMSVAVISPNVKVEKKNAYALKRFLSC